MARRLQRSFRGPGLRRSSDWSGIDAAVVVNLPAANKLLLVGFVPTAAEMTIHRIRGLLIISADVTTSENQVGAIGAIIATDTAVAAGVASLPDPLTDINDDGWLMYQAFGMRSGDPSGTGNQTSLQVPFDSKAMRKIQSGHQVVFVIANAHATHSFDIDYFNVRMLSKSCM